MTIFRIGYKANNKLLYFHLFNRIIIKSKILISRDHNM